MGTALLVLDMQMAMQDRIDAGRGRCNPDAEVHVASLLALFRARGLPVFHVWHTDTDPASSHRKGLPGADPMPCALPLEGEQVFWKSGSSAFSRTGLDPALRRTGIKRVVVVGAVAAYCVASTARAGADIGFDIVLPSEALLGFDLPSHDGGQIDANTALRVTLATLAPDFAQVVTTDQVAGII
jgi:nicotinamidase-related amidase